MNILIVEKTEDSFKLIAEVLAEYYPMSEFIHCRSVQDTLAYLAMNGNVSLGFFEIELADGLCFEIFREANVAFPIVFMSAYDKYWLQAMPFNAIDYLRKPLEKMEIIRVLDKYEILKKHFLVSLSANDSVAYYKTSSKDRLVAKKGTNYYVIKLDEIAFIYTESRVIFLIDKNGERYTIEKNLSELELELPGRQFFRVNRKFIVSIDAIKSFKPSFKGKIALELMHLSKAEVSISQENAAQFKKWIEG